MKQEKYDALKEYVKTIFDSKGRLIADKALAKVLKQLIDDLISEIDSNKEYYFLNPTEIANSQTERLLYTDKLLNDIKKAIRPIPPINTNFKRGTLSKQNGVSKFAKLIPENRNTRVATFGYLNGGWDEARTRADNEVKFIDEQIKRIEMLKDAEIKIPLPDVIRKEETPKTAKDKLTHKQQILLLKQLGVFELDFFNHLNETQKGVLFSYIVNRDEKNTEDNIRYVKGSRTSEDTKKIFTKKNVDAVNELLEKVGLKNYKIH